MHNLFPDLKDSEIADLSFLGKDDFIDTSYAIGRIGLNAVKALKKDFAISHCLCQFNDILIVEVLLKKS